MAWLQQYPRAHIGRAKFLLDQANRCWVGG